MVAIDVPYSLTIWL